MLDISVPWATSGCVQWTDSVLPPGSEDNRYSVLVREYDTPDGPLRHAVRHIDESQGPGWVTPPDHVPLIEDFNVSRAVQHLVSNPEDVQKVAWLFQGPGTEQASWFQKRMKILTPFAEERGVMIQAWSAFGADAAVWIAGAEGAVLLCMEHPAAFCQLLDLIHKVDLARTRLALEHEVDMVVQRGWYSSTDFWSPRIFKEYFKPRIAELAALAHSHGRLFGYVMTTGVMTLGKELIEAGVDLLYYVDPVQDQVDLTKAASGFRGSMAVAGGMNSGVTLARGSVEEIRKAVSEALAAFGNEGGFILSPVDALFPDTPCESVDTMIQAWQELM